MKFDIGDFYENMSKYKVAHNRTKNIVDGNINSPETRFCSTISATLCICTLMTQVHPPLPFQTHHNVALQ